MTDKKIRVLVVDDSALMRKRISDIINSDEECEVIATARNGEEAIKSAAILRPDVITLDIQMPTMDGVTAVQLDVKVDGVPVSIMNDALAAARKARLHILDTITAAIPAPRATLSPRAPKIVTLSIPVDMIGLVIGPGGKNIKKIQEDSGVSGIAIEDDGSIFVTGVGDAPEKAAQMIRDMTRVFQAGDVVEGPVTRIMDFGAFVAVGGKSEGLVHISEFAPFRIATVQEAVAVGEIVRAVVKEIDEKGRINLSIKMVDPEFATRKNLKPAPAGDGPHGHGGQGRMGGHGDGRPPHRNDRRW